MSVPAVSGLPLSPSGLPVVNQTLTLKGIGEPAWVRDGSATTQKAYQTALAFEQVLVEQLSQSLTASSGLSGESSDEGESPSEGGSSGSSAASGPLSSMLPQALTSGVMNAGGLGLAAQMTRQLASAAGATPTNTSGNADTTVTGDTTVTDNTSASSNVTATGGTSA